MNAVEVAHPVHLALRRLTDAGLIMLCGRFLFAATVESSPAFGVPLILAIGAFGLAWWQPRTALFAFMAFLPWFNGLGQSGLVSCAAPGSLVFSSMFLGWKFRGGRPDPTKLAEATEHRKFPFIEGICTVLNAAILLSLAAQIFRSGPQSEFLHHATKQAVFGFGDPYYFLTSSLIWLQGLALFRRLSHDFTASAQWLGPIVTMQVASMVFFVLFQWISDVPTLYNGYAFFLPYEDISSFGSVAATLLIYVAATWKKSSAGLSALRLAGVVVLFAMVVVSWSRATWAVAIFLLLVIAGLRLPKSWRLGIVASVVLVVAVANMPNLPSAWKTQPYIFRLVSLARLESPVKKDPTRFDLYGKAFRMIWERPFTGHGIGSFYSTSVRYARLGDPYAAKPDFAHNTLLLLAAELGAPAALLFGGLCGWLLWLGLRFAGLTADGTLRTTALGLTLAVVTYLLTQMTANSLNVYASNQFFFWFLVASLFQITRSIPASAAQAIQHV